MLIQLLPSSTVAAVLMVNTGTGGTRESGTPPGTVMFSPTVPGWMHPGALAWPLLTLQIIGAISGGTREPLQYWCVKPGFVELLPGVV
jgi:hypothetical protein